MSNHSAWYSASWTVPRVENQTGNTGWKIEVVNGRIEQLLQSTATPILLRVRFDESKHDLPARWAWSSGTGHVVVLYGLGPDGRVELGDPASGRVKWTFEDLQRRWRGEGLRLIQQHVVHAG